MYDVGGKLLNEIKSMYIDSLAYVKVKGYESDCFSIDSGVRQSYITTPWLFNVYMNEEMKEVQIRMGMREENRNYLASYMQVTLFGVES